MCEFLFHLCAGVLCIVAIPSRCEQRARAGDVSRTALRVSCFEKRFAGAARESLRLQSNNSRRKTFKTDFSYTLAARLLILLQYKKPEGAAKIETKASADVLATMAHAPRDFMKSNRSKIAQQSAANGVKEN